MGLFKNAVRGYDTTQKPVVVPPVILILHLLLVSAS